LDRTGRGKVNGPFRGYLRSTKERLRKERYMEKKSDGNHTCNSAKRMTGKEKSDVPTQIRIGGPALRHGAKPALSRKKRLADPSGEAPIENKKGTKSSSGAEYSRFGLGP